MRDMDNMRPQSHRCSSSTESHLWRSRWCSLGSAAAIISPATRSSGRPKVTRVSRGSRCAAQQQPAVSTRSGEEVWNISSGGGKHYY